MLSLLKLQNFKCFEILQLPLSSLTLLSGPNASGKSSVLQALVLLNQTMREHEWSPRLMLNGETVRLGTVSDVVDKIHGRRSFGIGIVGDRISCEWTFSGERHEMSMMVDRVVVGSMRHEPPKEMRFLLPRPLGRAARLVSRLRELSYITAERIGPRDIYNLKDRQTTSVVGPDGENAVSLLHLGRVEHVSESLVLEGAPPTLLRQVEERMRMFFPGFGLIIQTVPQMNAVTLGLRTSPHTDFHRPVNVGFGLMQVFPIVVAALSARNGDVLLIENPEVHLHPAGQALMGQFLAAVARAGVQVIVESHSDHLLNGVRRSVKSGALSSKEVAIHFFRPPSPDEAQVISPHVDGSGNLDIWPSGFFDQFDKDMNYFAGWGA